MQYKLCGCGFPGAGFPLIGCDSLPRIGDTIRYQHTPKGEAKAYTVTAVDRYIDGFVEEKIEVWVDEQFPMA